VPEGIVEPGKVLESKGRSGAFLTYLIEARDSKGNTIYSKEFTAEELMKANWKVGSNCKNRVVESII